MFTLSHRNYVNLQNVLLGIRFNGSIIHWTENLTSYKKLIWFRDMYTSPVTSSCDTQAFHCCLSQKCSLKERYPGNPFAMPQESSQAMSIHSLLQESWKKHRWTKTCLSRPQSCLQKIGTLAWVGSFLQTNRALVCHISPLITEKL